MSSTIQNKISSLIQTQFPEFIQSDHSTFVQFLKYYYQFLESGKLTITGTNSYLRIETQSVNYVLDQNLEKVVLEDSSIKFTIGEEIVGQTSGAKAKVLVDDFDRNFCLFISAQQLFIPGEEIVGSTSGAKSIVQSYQANPVQNIQQFLEYVDADYTVTNFLDKFRDAFMESLPNTLASGISKRNLIKNIKDLYTAKGTTDGHKLFFRILFGEEATILYPKDNILRASDGVWSTDNIMRVVEIGNSNFANLAGQIVYVLDAGEQIVARATVVTVVKFREGNDLVAELSLDSDSIVGTFNSGDVIYGIDTTLDIEISATIQSIVVGSNITDSGHFYSIEDRVYFGQGGNNTAVAKIDYIGEGSVDDIMIDNGGSGYTAGDYLTFDTSSTEGSGASAIISVVGGSILMEDGSSLLLENEDTIVIEPHTFGAIDPITNVFTPSTEYGEITRIKILNGGNGFTSLPKVSVNDYIKLYGVDFSFDVIGKWIKGTNSGAIAQVVQKIKTEVASNVYVTLSLSNITGTFSSSETIELIPDIQNTNITQLIPDLNIIDVSTVGTNAELFAISTKYPGIGHARSVAITNFGLQYETSPSISFIQNFIVKDVVDINGNPGTFTIGEVLTSHSATVISYNSNLRLLRVNSTDSFSKGDTIQGATSTAEIYFVGTASAESVVGTIGTTVGNFVNDKGKVSNDSMRIQDSYYYQDFSYIVRIGHSINEWRESHRKSVHPAGWNVFGEVSFSTLLRVIPKVPINVKIGGIEKPILDMELFYSRLFGRRLGTKTDTVLSQNPKENKTSPSNLLPGERDVTLTHETFVRLDTNRGSHRNGSTLADLVKYGFAVPPLLTDELANDYFDPSGRRITKGFNTNTLAEADALSANVTRDLYPIKQFKNYTIKSVSDYFFLKMDDGLGNKGGKIILEDFTDAYKFISEDGKDTIIAEDGDYLISNEVSEGFLQTEELGIPEAAHKVKLNVLPPSEINIYKPYTWNTFGNVTLYRKLELKPIVIQSFIGDSVTYDDIENVIIDYSTRLDVGANASARIVTTLRLNDNVDSLWKGSSLANLPKYAFVEAPASADEVTLYSIQQFKNRTIKSVSDYFFFKLNDEDKIVLEDSSGNLQTELLGIPDEAYTIKVNVPPRAEIVTA